MARLPCCDKTGLKRGKWSDEEDEKLINYIKENGEGSWRALPRNAGLSRCGKSCRLRWINYLRSDVKRGNFTQEEEEIIAELQRIVGNKWSLIASHLPGRTDNDIKNYWNSHLSRKIYQFRPKGSSRFRSTYPFAETFRRGVNKAKEENHNVSNKQAMQEEMALDPQGLSEQNPNVLDSISDWDGWSIPADNEMMMAPRLEFDQVQLDMSFETENINEIESFSPCPNMESNSFTSLESGLFVCSSPSLVSNDICWDFDAGAGNEVDLWSGEMSLWNWE